MKVACDDADEAVFGVRGVGDALGARLLFFGVLRDIVFSGEDQNASGESIWLDCEVETEERC